MVEAAVATPPKIPPELPSETRLRRGVDLAGSPPLSGRGYEVAAAAATLSLP